MERINWPGPHRVHRRLSVITKQRRKRFALLREDFPIDPSVALPLKMRLYSGIVELADLASDDGAEAEHKDKLNVGSGRDGWRLAATGDSTQ